MSKGKNPYDDFPAALHEPRELGKIDLDDAPVVTVKFTDMALWVVRAIVKNEGDYVVVYTASNGVHVFNKGVVAGVIES